MDSIHTNIKSMLYTVKENIEYAILRENKKNAPHGKKMTPDRASAYGQESYVRLGFYHQ